MGRLPGDLMLTEYRERATQGQLQVGKLDQTYS